MGEGVERIMVAEHNRVSSQIIAAAIEIHRGLGPGLLESVYAAVLAHEVAKRGLSVAAEVPVPVVWDGKELGIGFRADLIVQDLVVVELKSVEQVSRAHKKQVLTYLRLTDKRLGLLINFGEATLKDGISRIVNGL